jgi:hypothetical protein
MPSEFSLIRKLLLTSLLVCIVAGTFRFSIARADIDRTNKLIETGAFDAVTSETAEPGNGCAAISPVRWMPGAVINVSYAGNNFTDSEKAALRQAFTRWQQALAQTSIGISFVERADVEKETVPQPWQLIVKRDAEMGPNRYGRIVALARPDNFLESASILINSSIHKPKLLRKVMLHELGHALGLRDCTDCRKGATVMNHFLSQSVFGIKIRDGNVAGQPTASDISQVVSGYDHTAATQFAGASIPSEARQTIVADEIAIVANETKVANENILSSYLSERRPTDERTLTSAENTEFESFVPTLLETEAATMNELKNYTFRRDVLIQTIDKKGRVTGEYHRASDMLLDDEGRRIERNLSLENTTLKGLEISSEYVEDFSGAQLKGFELARRDHYRFEPFGLGNLDGNSARIYRVTPLDLASARANQDRVFYGFIWIDEKSGRILKIAGCALPDDQKRFPLFETHRELIDGEFLFPVRTIADDRLVFPSRTVHVRMLITYSNYRRFGSRVNIVEAEEVDEQPAIDPASLVVAPLAVHTRKQSTRRFFFDYFCRLSTSNY